MDNDEQEQFIKVCLNVHNRYRAIHGAPNVKVNSKLNDYARERAEVFMNGIDILLISLIPK